MATSARSPWVLALLPLLAAACGGAGSGTGSAAGGGAAGSPPAGGSTATGGSTASGGSSGVAGSSPAGGEGGGWAGAPGGSGGAPSGQLELAIVGGDYQMVTEFWPAGELLVVEARAGGKPVGNQKLTWTFIEGGGSMPSYETVTDANGRSENHFTGSGVPNNVSASRQRLLVSTGSASTEFHLTTCDAGFGPPAMPLAVLEEPQDKNLGNVKAGSVLTGAVKVRVVNQAGPEIGQPLSQIGVRLANTDGTPASASCVGGLAITDAKGLATCDLAVGAKTGSVSFAVRVGGAIQFEGVSMNVVP